MLHLSNDDLKRLQSLLTLLHSPLEAADVDDWRRRVNQEARTLLGADKVVFMLSPASNPLISAGVDPAAIPDYLEHFAAIDPGAARRQALGLEIFTQSMIYDDTLPKTVLYNEFVLRYRLFHSIGLSVMLPGGDAGWLGLYLDRPGPSDFEERGLGLLTLLLPAFKAGINAHLLHQARRAALASLLDRMTEGLVLFDVEGRVLHANPAFLGLLSADPERRRVNEAMQQVVQTLARLQRPSAGHGAAALPASGEREVQTARQRYRITGTFAGPELVPAERAILVTLQPLAPRLPAPPELRARFQLTKRESEVALLLARGQAAAQVAESLRISLHTARRHVEKVLQKLGVHSRAEVAPRILGV